MSFNNRIFGAAIIKAVNSNYNADFSHQPRTLPNGVAYATDKTLKYAIKNYLKDVYDSEKIFYFKRFRQNVDDFVPFSLVEAFCSMFPELAEITGASKDKVKLKANKKQVGKALLDCLDIRLFGATFAMKGAKKEENLAISIHGPVQINHAVNTWKENNIYSEQIMSPFRNPGDNTDDSDEEEQTKGATTLGRQSRLQEGHYLHHFSVNPKNLEQITKLAGDGAKTLTKGDIDKLKEALRKAVTWYDSCSKAGCENELLVWVQLKPESKAVLPNFTQLLKMEPEKQEGKVVLNCSQLKERLSGLKDEVEKIEFYINKDSLIVKNSPVQETEI
jgi:CRISPR-associated protein Csh2